MKKSYKARLRETLGGMEASNRHERGEVSMASVEKKVRADLQREKPHLSVGEIDERVKEIVSRGSAPTKALAPKPGQIPKDVLAARKAERKRIVKSNRNRRREW